MSTPGPVLGPCSVWLTGEDVAACCTTFAGSDPTVLDEYAVMAGVSLVPRADEPTRVESSSTFTDTGVIAGPGDTDAFTFTVPADAYPTTIAVRTSVHRPNLDLAATLTASGGQVVATSDPPASRVGSSTVSGLDASITANLAPGTYTLTVRGTGLAGVYSSYGSIGIYTVAVTTETSRRRRCRLRRSARPVRCSSRRPAGWPP